MKQAGTHKDQILLWMARGAVLLAFFVIGLGALTRLMDAGLGCPDWPGCYGHLIPLPSISEETWPHSPYVAYKAWTEMIHRYAVGVLGLLILAITAWVLVRKSLHTRRLFVLVTGLWILLIYQILLGQWTVTLRLWPVIVTQHLMGGFLILSLLWMISLTQTSIGESVHSKEGYVWTRLSLAILLLQILLGAWTSTNYASLSCPDFPFCLNDSPVHYAFGEAFRLLSTGINYDGGVLAPPALRAIQMTHRAGALLVSINLLALAAWLMMRYSYHFTRIAGGMMALLLMQACLGMINVLYHLPVVTAVCHTLVAALLLLTLITLAARIYP